MRLRLTLPFLLIILAFFVSLTLITPSHVQAEKWVQILNKSGVQVFTRKEPGRELPSFKGIGVVNADMYKILAVLRDGMRRHEWMTRSGVTRVLKRKSVFEAISYQQTLAPWPVTDRDVVMHTQIYLRKSPLEIIATFDGIPWKDKIKGVDRNNYVKMPFLEGYWRLVPKGEQKTEVTYMVNTEPGGMIPNWLAKRATKSIPYSTITKLRTQMKRHPGAYKDFLESYDPVRAKPFGGVRSTPPEPPQSVLNRLK
jgi:hypothetical protein